MPGDEMRASDQDREDAVRLFCQAYTVARLDLGDICDRAAAAYSARTWGDLRRLTADLPLPSAPAGPGTSAATRPAARPRPRRRPSRRLVVAVLLTALAWLAMTAADLMPIVAAPLAALPRVPVSMAALFAAARVAPSRRGERTREVAARHPGPRTCQDYDTPVRSGS
jgi:Domain of unknown function (DUF1707)